MKRKFLLTIIIAVFTFFSSRAQIAKGSLFLGGQINFYSQSNSSTTPNTSIGKNSSFYFFPAVGKAIKDNTVVGVDLLYGHSELKNDFQTNPSNQNNNSFGAGVFMRRYVFLGKGFYVFGQGRFGGAYTSSKTDNGINPAVSDDTKGYSFTFGFYPGLSYQVSKRLQIETGFNNVVNVNYEHTKNTETDPGATTTISKSNTFNIGTSLNNLASFTLGFRVLLNKNK